MIRTPFLAWWRRWRHDSPIDPPAGVSTRAPPAAPTSAEAPGAPPASDLLWSASVLWHADVRRDDEFGRF